METYNSGNVNGTGVTAFEIGEDFIILIFRHRYKYKYTYNSCGSDHIEKMKQLARHQNGLNTYKNKHNPQYDWRIDTGNRTAA